MTTYYISIYLIDGLDEDRLPGSMKRELNPSPSWPPSGWRYKEGDEWHECLGRRYRRTWDITLKTLEEYERIS